MNESWVCSVALLFNELARNQEVGKHLQYTWKPTMGNGDLQPHESAPLLQNAELHGPIFNTHRPHILQ
jgi:hypothetical protein